MAVKNIYHLEIISQLHQLYGGPAKTGLFMVHYCGSDKPGYDLKTAIHTKIIKNFVEKYSLSVEESIELISSLFQKGQSFNEIIIGGSLVSHLLTKNNIFDPQLLDLWLDYVHGWAETDVLCQSNFAPDIVLGNWSDWQKVLKKFVSDSNVHKRRASLVLLCKSIRLSPDPRLLTTATQNIDKLKSDKDILITKAVSWLLRSMVTYHPDFLADYLEKNKDTLPRLVYREAYTKLTTGRKYNRPQNYSTKVKA